MKGFNTQRADMASRIPTIAVPFFLVLGIDLVNPEQRQKANFCG
jgi:hypothetical protein